MGFEGPRKSIDDILAGLNDGTIERGDKGTKRIETPQGITVTLYAEDSITFVHNGLRIEADIDGTNLQLVEEVNNKPVQDNAMAAQYQKLIRHWYTSRILE